MLPIMQSAKSMVNSIGFWGKQHAPGFCIGFGMSLGFGGAILAVYETTKELEIIGEAQAEIDAINDTLATSESYTQEEAKSDKKNVYLRAAGKTVINYAPALAAEIAGAAFILKGANILNDRYTIMSACASSALLKIKDMRKRVIEKFGEEVDKEIYYGINSKEIKEKITDEDGKTKTVKKNIAVIDGNKKNSQYDYTRIFDRRNPYYDKDISCNIFFLRSQQSYFNDKLMVEHHVFLNDVLIALGFQPTRAGQEVGWNYDPDNPNIDNCVDFGMVEARLETENGYEDVILLDFNVDGSIINKVEWRDL